MTPPAVSTHPRQAFSLLELLIVIAVVAIVVSLSLPVAKGIREQGQTSRCTANLRQIGMALLSYAADNDGKLPPRSLGLLRTPGNAKPPADERTWAQRLYKFGYLTQVDAFYCPSEFPKNDALARKKAINGASQIYGYRIWITPGGDWSGEEREEHRKMSSIKEPGDFFLVADSYWTDADWESQGYSITPGSQEQLVHLRHSGKANAVFADGHVELKDRLYFEALSLPERQQAYGGEKARRFYCKEN